MADIRPIKKKKNRNGGYQSILLAEVGSYALGVGLYLDLHLIC